MLPSALLPSVLLRTNRTNRTSRLTQTVTDKKSLLNYSTLINQLILMLTPQVPARVCLRFSYELSEWAAQ